ncbi:unnamed protein product [Durusdinium trenchii]|uniref:Uncharacterized protein n=1 Tax=Durusdinium trenchii TaxID=1381693 RepID=A0ABP0Q3T4_9DINO
MPLLADVADADFDDMCSRFDIANVAAPVLGACATRRRVNLAWTFFLQLLRGESVAMNGDPGPVIVMSDLASQMPSLTNLKTPVSSAGFELTLPCRNFKDDSQHKKQLSISARVTTGHTVIATIGSAQRHSMLRVLSGTT